MKVWPNILPNPMMYSDGKAKRNESPPIKVRLITMFEYFLPPDLKGLEFTILFHEPVNITTRRAHILC